MKNYEILIYVMYGCFLLAGLFCITAIIHGMKHSVKTGRKELKENKELLDRAKVIKEAEAILPDVPQPEKPKPMLTLDPSVFKRITIESERQRWTTEYAANAALNRVFSLYLTEKDGRYILKES